MKWALLIALLKLPALGLAAECGNYQEKWVRCTSAADCLIGFDACDWPKAYNKRHYAAARKYNVCAARTIDCEAPKEAPRAQVECVKKKCELKND